MQHMPPPRHHGARADVVGTFRQDGPARRRADRGGRRGLHPRIDREPRSQGGHRLPAHHAHLPRTAQRRRDHPAHPLYTIDEGPARGRRRACASEHTHARRERTHARREHTHPRPQRAVAEVEPAPAEAEMNPLPPMPPGMPLPPGFSLAPIPIEEAPEPPDHYLNHSYGLASWLLTKDHKRIAILYLISVSIF